MSNSYAKFQTANGRYMDDLYDEDDVASYSYLTHWRHQHAVTHVHHDFCFRFMVQMLTTRDPVHGVLPRQGPRLERSAHSIHTTITAKDLSGGTLDRLVGCPFTLRNYSNFVSGSQLISLARTRDLPATHCERDDAAHRRSREVLRPGALTDSGAHSRLTTASKRADQTETRINGLAFGEFYAWFIG
jgi:hypothetical protein